jgi:hypothetical protein
MNILALNGKIQSGKDQITKMIQYLTSQEKNSIDYFSWEKSSYNIKNIYTWENKKYAAALRKVCSVLLGIPEEQFEDINVKNLQLSEEWWYVIRDGKLYPYEQYKEGDVIYKPTVRNFIQRVGTEAFRQIIHPNTWINALYAEYKPKYIEAHGEGHHWINSHFEDPKWIISDVRFIGEADAVKKRNGAVIRVNRYDLNFDENNYCTCGKNGICPNNKIGDDKKCHHSELERYFHESETNMDNYKFDYVIENKGSKEELLEKVKLMLKHFNIL